MQHSDQAEDERASVLQSFQAAVQRWQHGVRQKASSEPSDGPKLHILVTTDSCAPPVHHMAGEHSLHARLLINFDVPQKKVQLLAPSAVFWRLWIHALLVSSRCSRTHILVRWCDLECNPDL